MTNFDVIKKTPLGEILSHFGFEDEVHINAFMNIFQCIPCRCCPIQSECNGAECCQAKLRKWLESEVKESVDCG